MHRPVLECTCGIDHAAAEPSPEAQAAWAELVAEVVSLKDARAELGRYADFPVDVVNQLVDAYAPRLGGDRAIALDWVWEAQQRTKACTVDDLVKFAQDEQHLQSLTPDDDGVVRMKGAEVYLHYTETPHFSIPTTAARLEQLRTLRIGDTFAFEQTIRTMLDPAVMTHQSDDYRPAPQSLGEVAAMKQPVIRYLFQDPHYGTYIGRDKQPFFVPADVLLTARTWRVVGIEEHGIAADASVRDLWIVLRELADDSEPIEALLDTPVDDLAPNLERHA
ncbi:hypothetical protein [Demequina iriomotensis]|uniref:hypothetical protein n=1 Tax=Demequina iriomotensis TaxID=1536641 RepID=UPI0007826DAB|nr:hypothetical protein [Demequina iriomotensis]